MSDFIVSPRFDRPPPVGGWFKSALGSALFEAPLAVAFLAATLNCSYAPPARAALDVRRVTAPDQGWLQVQPFNPALVVPAVAQATTSTYRPSRVFMAGVGRVTAMDGGGTGAWDPSLSVGTFAEARNAPQPWPGARLRLGTHDTAPAFTWLQVPDALFNAPNGVASRDARRNNSFAVPADPVYRALFDDTTPNTDWISSAATSFDPRFFQGFPPDRVPDARPGFRLGTHDTAPAFSWLQAPDVLFDDIGIEDAAWNCYVPPARAVLRNGIHDTAPSLAWIYAGAVAPTFNPALAVPVVSQATIASYRPSRIVVGGVGRTTPGGTGGTGVPPWDPSLTVGPETEQILAPQPWAPAKLTGLHLTAPAFGWLQAKLATYPPGQDLVRSYLPATRAVLDVRQTSPEFGWIYATQIIVLPPFVPDAIRNAYRSADRAVLRPGLHDTAPEPAWIFSALPVVPPPTFPPAALIVRNSYSPNARGVLRLGVHDTTAEAAWIEYAAAQPQPVPPPTTRPIEAPRRRPVGPGIPLPLGMLKYGKWGKR
jgi:hypothetical protein